MRTVFVIRNGEVVDRAAAAPLHQSRDAPSVRADGMDPIRSMLDGQVYDSKSRYYGTLKAAGAEIVGNDKGAFDRRPTHEQAGFGVGVGRDISNAIDQLRSRG